MIEKNILPRSQRTMSLSNSVRYTHASPEHKTQVSSSVTADYIVSQDCDARFQRMKQAFLLQTDVLMP
jgi:predicted transcriptional regulator